MPSEVKITVHVISALGKHTASWPQLRWRVVPVEELNPAWVRGHRDLMGEKAWPPPKLSTPRLCWIIRFKRAYPWATHVYFEEKIIPPKPRKADPDPPPRPPRGFYNVAEGKVNKREEHIEIRYGKTPEFHQPDQWIPIARLKRHSETQFIIEYLMKPTSPEHEEILRQTASQVQFFICDKCEPNPWNYAIYHCTTYANIYSSVHWLYFKAGNGNGRTKPSSSPPVFLRGVRPEK